MSMQLLHKTTHRTPRPAPVHSTARTFSEVGPSLYFGGVLVLALLAAIVWTGLF